MVAVIAVATVASPMASALEPAKIEAALQLAYDKYKNLKEGVNANYIPVLAKVDSNIFGIALVTTDGKVYSVGDINSEVSIQSILFAIKNAHKLDDVLHDYAFSSRMI